MPASSPNAFAPWHGVPSIREPDRWTGPTCWSSPLPDSRPAARLGTAPNRLAWIERAPAPYFQTEAGVAWTPIGQNDAVTWPELAGLYRRRDLPGVERHLHWLAGHGVTCLRVMLEYCQTDNRYFEAPAGRFNPAMVQLWDDLFAACARAGLRVLLTPLDTFFMWNRWPQHPYNAANGGPCPSRTQLLVHPGVRDLVKRRLAFATGRWGGDGTLFAWDLWNEMHPMQAGGNVEAFSHYIDDVGPFLRELEIRLHGRAHLQTVSIFGPELGREPALKAPIFRHPALDFANSHFYEEGTIDDPRDTVAPACAVARLTREALSQIEDERPFFDSEHGPIHTFKDHHKTLPAGFDDEYFRHMQWAHLACGAAGGGMRWPNRTPHTLTEGMRHAQRALAGFVPLIDWTCFHRREMAADIEADDPQAAIFACGDSAQVMVWVLRTSLRADGRVDGVTARGLTLRLKRPDTAHRVALWDTREGRLLATSSAEAKNGVLTIDLPPFGTDVALAIREDQRAPGDDRQADQGFAPVYS